MPSAGGTPATTPKKIKKVSPGELMILWADACYCPDCRIHGVDSSNDVVFALRQVKDSGRRHCHAARTIKGCFQWVAAVARVASLSRPGHSMDRAAL